MVKQSTHSSIIFLNGTSSAGKTTLAKALQEVLEAPYLHLGIDTFLSMAPAAYLDSSLPGASQVVVHEADGQRRIEIRTGLVQEQLLLGMYAAMAALAAAGNNLIIDDVILEQRWLLAALSALRPYRVLFVGVVCPIEVAEERERQRGNRVIGMARGYLERVHQHKLYDLIVDTHALSLDTCVQRVLSALQAMPARTAFVQLWERYGQGEQRLPDPATDARRHSVASADTSHNNDK
jgi:chloramphenicol 3-O phosphotransferase